MEDLQNLIELDKVQRQQRLVLDDFFNTKLWSWLKFLTLNSLEQMQIRISRLIRDMREFVVAKKSLEELFFEFFLQEYFKLLVIKSRNSISKILSYLNFFRLVQKYLNNL